VILESRDLGRDLASDVCVVGAGPAGISVALELEAAGLDVALIVGGGLEPEARYQDLNRSRQIGLPTDAVEEETVRGLGGTSSRWGGWCRPLDPLDFEQRAEIPESGWPFDLGSLDAHYAKAFDLCGATPTAADPSEPALDSAALRHVRFSFPPPRRFGTHFRPQLAGSSRIRVLVDASALEIEPDPGGERIVAVRAATLGGHQTRVRARCFVVACGTIQTTRLLLCSRAQGPRGLGNQNDLVGRYFMQHPEHVAQLLTFTRNARRALDNGMAIALAPSLVRQERLLNCHFLLRPSALRDPRGKPPVGRLR
jgi:choline dehydrogenase-like flavoprotein